MAADIRFFFGKKGAAKHAAARKKQVEELGKHC